MKQFKLNVFTREGTGRSASRRLRSSGKIPAVLYGKRTAPVSLALDVPEFTRLIKSIAGSTALIELSRSDKAGDSLSVIQEIQRDPMTDNFLHVDLQEVSADEKMDINVTVHVVGEAYGVKNESGLLDTASHQVSIRCLPRDLPSFIEVDVTELRVGETIHVRDLKPIPGVEFRDDPEQPVVSCVVVAAEAEAAPSGAPAEAAAAATAPATAAPAGAAAAPAAGAAPAKKAPEKK